MSEHEISWVDVDQDGDWYGVTFLPQPDPERPGVVAFGLQSHGQRDLPSDAQAVALVLSQEQAGRIGEMLLKASQQGGQKCVCGEHRVCPQGCPVGRFSATKALQRELSDLERGDERG